ncbi:hypothetical protein, partial [Acetobacter oeni]
MVLSRLHPCTPRQGLRKLKSRATFLAATVFASSPILLQSTQAGAATTSAATDASATQPVAHTTRHHTHAAYGTTPTSRAVTATSATPATAT